MTNAYKPYVDYILNGGVAETAYILSHQGAICATNLPIQPIGTYGTIGALGFVTFVVGGHYCIARDQSFCLL